MPMPADDTPLRDFLDIVNLDLDLGQSSGDLDNVARNLHENGDSPFADLCLLISFFLSF